MQYGFFAIGVGLSALVLIELFITIFGVRARYDKFSCCIEDEKIHLETGGLFSDKQTELKYENITHVRLIKPFLAHRFFQVGTLSIEAAGSSEAEITIPAINNPESAYKSIQDVLAKKHFSLSYEELLRHDMPTRSAVALDIFVTLFSIVVTFLFIALAYGDELHYLVSLLPGFLLTAGVFLCSTLSLFVVYVYYKDLAGRNYYIYNDVISYSRGFLTKQKAFIPVENLSDSTLRQSVLEKLMGVYDVVISCQGNNSKISFVNLKHGRDIEKVVSHLINSNRSTSTAASNFVEHNLKDTINDTNYSPLSNTHSSQQPEVQSFYRDTRRTLMPFAPMILIVWLIPPLLIFPFLSYLVSKRTEFRLGKRSIASHFNFLSTRHIEFSQDKVTGMVIRRGVLDRFCNTCSVTFWSIGTAETIQFQHIVYDEATIKSMQMSAGIVSDDQVYSVRPQYSFVDMLLANLIMSILSLGSVLFFIVLTFTVNAIFILPSIGIIFAYARNWLVFSQRYKQACISLHRSSLVVSIGWLQQKQYIIKHKDITDVTTTKYPLSKAGAITFNIAGSSFVSAQSSKSAHEAAASHSVSIGYVSSDAGIFDIHDQIDSVLEFLPNSKNYLNRKTAFDVVPLYSSSRRIANDIVAYTLVYVLLFPLLILLPISLAFRYLWVRSVMYDISEQRIRYRSGVVYHKQSSILYSRIDHIDYVQHALNKLFDNGTVRVYTSGGGNAELTLKNMRDYVEFYRRLNVAYSSSQSAAKIKS